MNLSHDLAFNIKNYPTYNKNLGLVAEILSKKYLSLNIIDVGANVGDSVVIIQDKINANFLCIEGNPKFIPLLKENQKNLKNIQISSLTGEWDSVSNKKIVLKWQTPKYIKYSYIIEKAQLQSNIFYEIGTTNEGIFVDYNVKKGVQFYYRIRIKENNLYSAYSNVIEIAYQLSTQNQTNEIVKEDLILYPNPVIKNNNLSLWPMFDKPIVQVRITNLVGKTLYDKPNLSENIMIPTNDFSHGLYIIEVILEDNTKLIKKFIVH
jgi:hypothetical protein